MKNFKENDTVIFTDKNGKRFDTFVIFDTDRESGLTHINHFNLKVPSENLEIHSKSLTGNSLPLADNYSFLLFNKLKEKYAAIDKKAPVLKPVMTKVDMAIKPGKLAKAS
jgi:hypothetical protein